jgi:hypothetical protein
LQGKRKEREKNNLNLDENLDKIKNIYEKVFLLKTDLTISSRTI